jgi:nicotinamide riboside kinase
MLSGEKIYAKMNKTQIKIVLTGAESTGKSFLSRTLSSFYNGVYVPEFARTYIENLHRKYTYADIEYIARKQIEDEVKLNQDHTIIFFDTWLIITKVWFDFVYNKHPLWLHQAIVSSNISLFLLCNIDMPWEDDPVRENGGVNRQKLHNLYINELEKYGFKYRIVEGIGEQRVVNAKNIVQSHLDLYPAVKF